MSSPPATSMMKICASTRPLEKVAVRLSPPDSRSTRSSGPVVSSRSSPASRLAAPGLHGPDALRREHGLPQQELGILPRVDVVGDDRDLQLVPQRPAQSS